MTNWSECLAVVQTPGKVSGAWFYKGMWIETHGGVLKPILEQRSRLIVDVVIG